MLLLFLLAAAALLSAQYRSRRPAPHLLRAVSVLEWPASGRSAPRLVPLIILAEGKFYDASIYLAAPVPLAVQPGNVYEGQQNGVAKGLFTISEAQQVKEAWYGAGVWAEGATGTYATAPREEDRPVLRRARPGAADAAPAGAPPAQAPTEKQLESDAGRPVLHHGKGESTPPVPPPPPAAAKPPAAAAAATVAPAPPAPRRMLAVSDAQPSENRSYALSWTPEEEARLQKSAVALAQGEIAKYAFEPGRRALPGPLADLQVRFFDLYTDNSPQVVLSARLPAGTYAPPAAPRGARRKAPSTPAAQQPDIYVTLVARADLEGNLRKLFSTVTDSRHLDVSPRLELLDAVDADGQGLGELLFHKIGPEDTGPQGNVVLYRVDVERLTELFDSWVR